ncbi:DUF2852 domain-containing protein [Pelagibacterium montanilacus]|uniref:DUF2852 domain-containing protein n=1 Tax=Pelagibacterium montanilacus TaxID=2185280 RepID=UPI000F8E7A16|nr:DUF2852 domain-containing protein [Pelagibacterium montanilacus]
MNTALIKPQWSALTIALMVLGFIVFWPLGLAMLAYILWGEYFGGSRERAETWLKSQKGKFGHKASHRKASYGRTGNAAFDDYRDEQLRRLEEERQRLEEERAAFEEYLDTLAKARDREEFDRFMAERRATTRTDYGDGHTA